MLWSKSSSFFEKITYLVLAIFMAFPLVDYIMRNILQIPVLSSVWDELLLFGGIALVGLRILFGSPNRETRLTKTIIFIILAGLAYLVLDMATFSYNMEGWRAMFQYMFVFFIGFYLNDRPENTKSLLAIAVVTGVLIGLYGIYQWIVKVPMPAHWIDASEVATTRAFSIVGSPNALGSQMALIASISLGLLMEEKNRPKKLFWLFSFTVLTICLVFTGSRGAWLAFAGALGIIGIIYDRRILFAGIAAVVIALVLVPAVRHRLIYLFSPEYMINSARSGRISRWFEAYDQMRNNPLFGAGLGHFGGAVAKRHYNTIYVDNYYMKTLAEMGLLGLTMFLWLIADTVRQGYRAMKTLASPRLKFMAMGMFAGLLAVILHNAVENIFEIPYLNSYFWLITGLLLALPFNSAKEGGISDDSKTA